ncbi:ABC transporter B family member 2 [Hibiscus syriacus]|uniref:ABC transporter B family member 2 n=1 Tax=Hibiscus syriacus TaxID=106335 RepID=A0A6A3C489_HIBSY|nr:ABC transporter B family member 2 [Hibiscus syriacus]
MIRRRKKKRKKVPLLKLFSFADFYDYVLMALGCIAACLHGASVPVFFVFFGKLYISSLKKLLTELPRVACWMHTGEQQSAKMRMGYLKSMLKQDISLFDTEASTGEVISAITSDIIVVQDALSEKVGNFMHYISRFIVGFIIGFARVWQISLVTLSIVPLITVAGGLYAYVATGLIARVRNSYVKAGEIAEEVIGNVRTVQAFSGEERAVKSYKEALMNTYKYGRSAGLARGLGLGSMHCVLFVSWALLVWSLGPAAQDISAFIRARVAAYPILEMIERNTISKTISKTCYKLGKVEGHIEFKDVTFSYPSRPDVLIFDRFSLNIPAGKIVALVGGNGSGKSTVISLIERFYEPNAGEILLDGNNVRDLDLKWLKQQIGKDDATLKEITRAAKLSEAIAFINNLPDRFETQVGERGIQLSGGKKQRIAISGAILKNQSILLLDEATSALDAESEKSVQEALDRVKVGRNTVVVANRLSTIRNADVIAVVRSRKIVETGSHDEFISNPSSAYSSLVQQQYPSHSRTMSTQLSSTYSRELSRTRTSFGTSFRSDKDSILSRVDAEAIDTGKPVSPGRLYSMIGPDWSYGVFGTIAALIAGAQMPLFALGVSQALVAYYMDWETTCREVEKISILFCCAAVLTVLVHAIEHLSILKNEIGWFDDQNNSSSMLASRLESDVTFLKAVVVDRTSILIQNLGLVVAAFIIAFILNWRITRYLGHFPIDHEWSHKRGYGGNLSKAYLKANMLAAEAVSNIRTVAAFCARRRSLISMPVSWYGSVLMGKELASFKSVMKSFMVLIITALAMGETLALVPDLLKRNQMVVSVFEIMDRKTQIAGDAGEELTNVEGTIELRGVQFSCPSRPDVVIFNGFDLKVRSGKSMALVGQSGSASKILISTGHTLNPRQILTGRDIRKLKLKSLWKHIGLVQQEPALFATSIYENILYGKEGDSESEIIDAAKLANAHGFISSLPEGYLTKVGERGVQLSGGQKQRVAITRAVLKNPEILLLDEATSALDMELECVVQQALERLMRNRTTVMVAHRLSTIKNSEKILDIQGGKIIEQGTHSSLIEKKDGAYLKLINLQQQQQLEH